jgi:hypothetical protein
MANNIVKFEVGKVYIGEQRHYGTVLSTHLFLCTKRTYRETRWSPHPDEYVSMHQVYSKPNVDLHWPTRVCKVAVWDGVERVDNAGLYGAYSVRAKDEYNGQWYEPAPKKKSKKRDVPIMKRELEL